jgi:hypothetical protein
MTSSNNNSKLISKFWKILQIAENAKVLQKYFIKTSGKQGNT